VTHVEPVRTGMSTADGGVDATEAAPLPPSSNLRWTAARKAAVVLALRQGTITESEARDHYMLSPEELAGWEAAFRRHGIRGLLAKSQ
jgi:Protein of unknown function (DUF1153)